MKKDMSTRWEPIRKQMARKTQRKYNRMLPLDEMLLDRWKKAELLGFGEKTSVYENVYVYGKPKVGKKVWIGPFVVLDASGGLHIGDGCDISCGAMIFTHSTHMRCVSEGKMNIIRKRVKIGNYVYLGSGAIVLPGVTIGDHCVVGAGAVVTKDVPACSLVTGIPARIAGRVILEGKSARIESNERPGGKGEPRLAKQTKEG
jgi:acetyltransferase-like isoleucine patch superfamily enzyme